MINSKHLIVLIVFLAIIVALCYSKIFKASTLDPKIPDSQFKKQTNPSLSDLDKFMSLPDLKNERDVNEFVYNTLPQLREEINKIKKLYRETHDHTYEDGIKKVKNAYNNYLSDCDQIRKSKGITGSTGFNHFIRNSKQEEEIRKSLKVGSSASQFKRKFQGAITAILMSGANYQIAYNHFGSLAEYFFHAKGFYEFIALLICLIAAIYTLALRLYIKFQDGNNREQLTQMITSRLNIEREAFDELIAHVQVHFRDPLDISLNSIRRGLMPHIAKEIEKTGMAIVNDQSQDVEEVYQFFSGEQLQDINPDEWEKFITSKNNGCVMCFINRLEHMFDNYGRVLPWYDDTGEYTTLHEHLIVCEFNSAVEHSKQSNAFGHLFSLEPLIKEIMVFTSNNFDVIGRHYLFRNSVPFLGPWCIFTLLGNVFHNSHDHVMFLLCLIIVVTMMKGSDRLHGANSYMKWCNYFIISSAFDPLFFANVSSLKDFNQDHTNDIYRPVTPFTDLVDLMKRGVMIITLFHSDQITPVQFISVMAKILIIFYNRGAPSAERMTLGWEFKRWTNLLAGGPVMESAMDLSQWNEYLT